MYPQRQFNSLIHHISFPSPCSSSAFPFVGARLADLSIRCTVTFVNSFHRSLWLVFSHNLSSSSAFLRLFVTQSSHHRRGLPRFLRPSCFFYQIFSSYVTTKLYGTSTCGCNNDRIFPERTIFTFPTADVCRARWPGSGAALVTHANMERWQYC